MSPTQLLVITKAPVPGRSKTRLTPPCTPEQAAAIASAAVGDTLDVVRATPVQRRVVALDGEPRDLDLTGCVVVPQVEGDLGTRLARAFADAMVAPDGALPTLLIGMDTPQVTPALLTDALDRLVAAGPGTAVLGTAPDGGWWALGLHSPDDAQVLPDVPMSRDDTAVLTRAALEEAGLTVLDLPQLTDVDHFPDALAVAALCPPGSRTRRVVDEVAAGLP
ncbi:TIGR04282 family arsenosugar biosynthesis glycosyltransferase [Modestobacter lacusdianchii]